MDSDIFQYEYDFDKLQIITPQNRDFKMKVAPRYLQHYLENSYEDFTADLLLNHSKNNILFIDIGAHYGFYTLLIGNRYKNSKIIAFEPAPDNYEIPRMNVELNNPKNTEIYKLAVSNKEEIKAFNIAEASDSCGFYPHPMAKTLKTTEVETVTFDNFLKDTPRIPTIIKIDTEGHEIFVLEGMKNILKNTEDIKLLMEFNPKMLSSGGCQPEELLDKLSQFGFNIFFINDGRKEVYNLN